MIELSITKLSIPGQSYICYILYLERLNIYAIGSAHVRVLQRNELFELICQRINKLNEIRTDPNPNPDFIDPKTGKQKWYRILEFCFVSLGCCCCLNERYSNWNRWHCLFILRLTEPKIKLMTCDSAVGSIHTHRKFNQKTKTNGWVPFQTAEPNKFYIKVAKDRRDEYEKKN